MCTISKCKTQLTSNQVAASCPTNCDFTIKCISLEQSMEDVNPNLQHSESSPSGTEKVFLSERVIFDNKWSPDAATKRFLIVTHIRIP